MPLDRHSRIKEVWANPVGRDLLQNLMVQLGRDERWLRAPFVGNMPLQNIDRIAGPGFADFVVAMAAHGPVAPAPRTSGRMAWWKEAVVYQVYLPSFADSDHDGVGDIGGLIQRLPYLEKLGVDALWLWPVLDAAGAGLRGVRDFCALQEEAGTFEDFETLMAQAHERGMRVLMGVEIDATASAHPWFRREMAHAAEADGPAAGDGAGFYMIEKGVPDAPPNNWMRNGVNSAWTWVPEISAWALSLAGRQRMNLNWENEAVRTGIAEALRFWLEKGVDGFFFGAVNTLVPSSMENGRPAPPGFGLPTGYEQYAGGPGNHRCLRALRRAMAGTEDGQAKGKVPFLAGEANGIGTEMAKFYTGAEQGELDLVLDFAHLTPRGRRGEEGRLELNDLKDYYLRWMCQYTTERWMPIFFETAETPRMVSRLGASALYRVILAKLLGTMLLTLRGTPIVYQGQELGVGNTRFASASELRDPGALHMYSELRGAMGDAGALQRVLNYAPDHARTPMPWNNSPKAGFTGAEPWMRLTDGVEYLNAAIQMEDAHSVWAHYQKLIALRKKYTCLRYGSFEPVFLRNSRVFCYFRMHEGAKWYVEMNLTEREVPRPGHILPTQHLALSNYDAPGKALRPYEANVYRCE
ncbi:MAG: alpha-amylase family glycosyl hydrolase [Oscillospiraceae bacterium]